MHEIATLGAVFTERPHVCRWNLERGFLSNMTGNMDEIDKGEDACGLRERSAFMRST